MARFIGASSLAQLVTLFFARAPHEELTTGDVSVKFDVPQGHVYKRLKPCLRDGLLACRSAGPGRGRIAVYSAGPRLLMLIGEVRAQQPTACVPVPDAPRQTENLTL